MPGASRIFRRLSELLDCTLTDPGADRIVFWDDSAGIFTFLTAGTGLTITGTTITAAGTTMADGDYGSVTVSGDGAIITINAGAVTNAMLAGSIDLTTKVTGTLPVANGGTGIASLGAGVATWMGTPSFANLNTALTGDDVAGLAASNAFTGTQTITRSSGDVLTITNSGTGGMGIYVNMTNSLYSDTLFLVEMDSQPLFGIDPTVISMGVQVQFAGGSSPTTSFAGGTAFDSNAWAASRGALQVYDGTANTYVVAALASDTPTNGQVPTWNTGGTITWETPSAGSGDVATDAIWDAAGDLVQGTGANTAARLAIGTAGQPLVVNAGATAVAYATLGYAGGGTNATTQAGARANLGGTRYGFANGTAVLAATPEFDGQWHMADDGYVGLGTGTGAGNVQGVIVVGGGTVYPVGQWEFSGSITQQIGNTSQLRTLTVTVGGVTVSAGNITAAAGSLNVVATGATGQHSLTGSHTSEDAVIISNSSSTGYSAVAFKYDGDNENKMAAGVGNSGTQAEFAGKAYLQFFDGDGVNPSPEFVIKQFGKYGAPAAQNYDRITIESAGNIILRGLTAGTIQSANYAKIDTAGLLTLNAGLTVSGGTTTIGSGTGPAKLTAGVLSADSSSGLRVQKVSTETSTSYSGTDQTPLDGTIPQWDEGTEVAALATTITPTNASNLLHVSVVVNVSAGALGSVVVALYRDPSGTDSAKRAWHVTIGGASYGGQVRLDYVVAAGSTSATTFKVMFGPASGITAYVNRTATDDIFGTAASSTVTIEETTP